MIFEKFSKEPIILDKGRVYEQKVNFKPRGFWMGVIDSDYRWDEWSRDNTFSLENLAIRHEIEVSDDWDILHLSNAKELTEFHDEYSVPFYPGTTVRYPDWRRVADDYDGLLVSPYNRNIAYYPENLTSGIDLMWYTTFDVASACIWNVEAIERITPLT